MTPLVLKAAYFALICLASAVLAILVYAKNSRHRANRFFALAVSCVSLWTLSNAFLHLLATSPAGLFWGRAAFASAALIPMAFLMFADAFQAERGIRPRWLLTTLVALGLAISLASFTPYLVTHVTVDARGLRLLYSFLYPIFSVYFLATFGASFIVLLGKYRRATRSGRLQLRYLFAGVFIGAAGGATTNLLVPLLLNTSSLSWAGPAFSFVALSLIAHAIFRHRLMDIRIALTRSASYFLSFVATIALLSLVFAVAHPFVASSSPNAVVLLALLAGLVLALGFVPMARLFQALLDRYAYRPPYDSHTLLEEASSCLPTLLHAQDLYSYLHNLLDRTVRPDAILVYLIQGGALHCVYSSSTSPLREPAPPLEAVVLEPFLNSTLEPILREEIDHHYITLLPQLESLPWDVLLPLRTASAATGFVGLGPKLSLDPYFSGDLAFLAAICRQVSVVLENVRLYAQVTTVKEHFERILDNMESGVIAVDARGTIFSFNPAAHLLLETTPGRLRGLSYHDLPEPLSGQIGAVLATATPKHQQAATLTTPSGRTVHLLLSSSPIHVAVGPSPDLVDAGAVIVFTNQTQVRELEAERRRADRLLDFQTMAAAIAHEIKNPLVAIKTFAELLPDRFGDREFRDTFSTVAVREIDRIDRLVARLRGASPDGDRPLVPVDLPALLSDLTALLRPQLDRSDLTLSTDYAPGTPPIPGHPAQLHQLFLNLLLNSVEALPNGGGLCISVQPSPDGARVTALIADTGPGIPSDLLDSIFDPFVSTKPNGSGLGLALCRTIATAHGALIRARNNLPAPGAAVTVDFPAWSSSGDAVRIPSENSS